MAARPWRPVWLLAACILAPMPAAAQCGQCSGAPLPAWICAHEVKIDGTGCTTFKDCVPPEVAGTRIDVLDTGGGTYEARLVVDVKAPRTSSNPYSFMKLKLYWSQGSVAGPSSSMCQLTMWDRTGTWLAYGGLTCAGAPYDFGTFSLYAVVCERGGSCQYAVPVEGLSFQVTKQTLGCPEPPKWACGGDAGCRECISVGPGTASPAGEGASASPPLSGPGAMLRYRAGGAGHPSWPGAAAWNQALGRYWSHDYTKRLVQDPDASHVWLLTRYATFREFTDADADGLYETVSPSDEQRELVKVAAGVYDCNGNLEKVWDANHPKASNDPTQTYSYDALDRLVSVSQPWDVGVSAVTSYGYDIQDHLTAVTDAEGNTTTYAYSDRDLLIQEVSPVSGTKTYVYNEHGEPTSETDARGITVTHTYDVLDRVTAVTYPDPSLNVTYTYDTPGTYSLGRLTGITRHGGTVVYEYDRFGRMTKDGDLTYGYNLNGNRTSVTYPGGFTAAYTHDHADRQASLSVTEGGNPPFAVVSSATYKPFGPLSSVLLGNGVLETRSFDARYQPAAIQASTAQSLLDWSYTLDPVGNITSIQDLLTPANSRTYSYRDIFYYLTQGDGPWGPRSWTYDRIGNRLTEVRGAVTDTYTYQVNAGGGNNPKLLSVAQGGGGGTRIFRYDAAGNTVLNMDDEQKVNLIPDGEGRMAFLRTLPEETITSFRYDGRSYLREAAEDDMGCSSRKTVSIYSSDGLLHRREHRLMADNTVLDGDSILYFAGRPVAVVNQGSPLATLTYLTTDHLGTGPQVKSGPVC